jgi:hypothetical protein
VTDARAALRRGVSVVDRAVVVGGRSSLEFGEFEEVVAEHAVAAPDAYTGISAQSGAAPRPVAFQVGDTAFASGAPFHDLDERVGVFDGGSCLGGFPGAGKSRRW